MRKINEIFYSLQGEGYHTGTPAIFVRFSGCNLKCDFCDTQHEEGKMMTDDEIIAEVKKYPAVKQGGKLAIDRMDEVKVVYEGQDISIFELLPAEHFFLQPCSCNNTASTVDCVMRHPKWRLSLQTHKLIDIR